MKVNTRFIPLFPLFFLLIFSANVQAQQKKDLDYSGFFDSYYYHQKYSFVAGVTMPFYFGDLCSTMGCTKINPGFTIGAGIKLWPRVYFGGEFNYFKLQASDENANRGYTFSSNNFELLALGRFYFIEDIVRKHQDLKLRRKFKFYGTLGLGANFVDPVATNTIDGSNLNTIEDQAYLKPVFALPVGLGLQYDLSRRIHIIAEGMYRFTFSDYVDGISQTANPNKNDAYLTFNLKVQYNPCANRIKKKKGKKIDPDTIIIDTSEPKPKKEAPKKENDNNEDDYEYNEGENEETPTEEQSEQNNDDDGWGDDGW